MAFGAGVWACIAFVAALVIEVVVVVVAFELGLLHVMWVDSAERAGSVSGSLI